MTQPQPTVQEIVDTFKKFVGLVDTVSNGFVIKEAKLLLGAYEEKGFVEHDSPVEFVFGVEGVVDRAACQSVINGLTEELGFDNVSPSEREGTITTIQEVTRLRDLCKG